MSIKAKMQSLIMATNAKTGKSDTDLTAAIQSLIDGYGAPVEQISFTIDDGSEVNTFSVVSGTTFRKWVGTSRVISGTSGLTLYCYSDDGIIFADEAGVNALGLNDSWVHGSDTIVSSATYTIIPCGG